MTNVDWVRDLLYKGDDKQILRVYRAIELTKSLGRPTDEIELGMFKTYLNGRGVPRWTLGDLRMIYEVSSVCEFVSQCKEKSPTLDLMQFAQEMHEQTSVYLKNLLISVDEIRFDLEGVPFVDLQEGCVCFSISSDGNMKISTDAYDPQRLLGLWGFDMTYNLITEKIHPEDPREDRYSIIFANTLKGTAKLMGKDSYFDHLLTEDRTKLKVQK